MYIAEISRILVFLDIDKLVEEAVKSGKKNYIAFNVKPIVWYDKFPTEKHHGWKYIKFGPDGKINKNFIFIYFIFYFYFYFNFYFLFFIFYFFIFYFYFYFFIFLFIFYFLFLFLFFYF